MKKIVRSPDNEDPLEISSHEIKNTLSVIKVFTQILEKRLSNTSDNKALSYLAKIDSQINRLTEIFKGDSGQDGYSPQPTGSGTVTSQARKTKSAKSKKRRKHERQKD